MDDARMLKRAAMRRATFNLVLSVIVLDALALGVYFGTGLSHSAPRIRLYFTVAWTVATALIVATMLKKVRKARFRY